MAIRKRKWTTSRGETREAWLVGYKDKDGKRRHKQFERKKDAEACLEQVRDELRRGVHVADRATTTVAEAWTSYQVRMEHEHRLGRLSGTYVASQRHYAEQNVLPAFGRLKLTEITSRLVQAWVDEMRVRPRPDGIGPYKATGAGKPYGRRTVERMVNVIQGILDHAVGEGWLARSPLRDHRVRVAPERLDHDPEYPTMADLQALLDTIDSRHNNERYHYWRTKRVLFTLLLFGGMRREEAVALQWENVDFDRREIRVRHGFNEIDKLRRPKSSSGRRVIPMVPQVHEALRWHADWCGRTTGYVLQKEKGGPLGPTTISGSWWQKLMRAAGVVDAHGRAKFTVHKLRYATIARMLAQGLQMFEIAKLVGHKDLRMIMRVYGYLFSTDAMRAAMEKDAAQLPVKGPRRAPPPPPSAPILALPAPGDGGPVIDGTAVVVPSDNDAAQPMTRRRLAVTLWQQGRTMSEAAEYVGVSEAAVHQWIRKAEELGDRGGDWLDRPDPIGTVGTTWADIKRRVRELWAEGVPMREIAPRFGVTESACYKWVKASPAVVPRPEAPRAAPRKAKRVLQPRAKRGARVAPPVAEAVGAAGERPPAAQLSLFGDAA